MSNLFQYLTSSGNSTGPSFGGYAGIGMSGLNSLNTLNKTGDFNKAGQSFFGIDSENDSEVMQSLKGAGKGAQMGAAFGPIGAAAGAVLGLGASFLDDI